MAKPFTVHNPVPCRACGTKDVVELQHVSATLVSWCANGHVVVDAFDELPNWKLVHTFGKEG